MAQNAHSDAGHDAHHDDHSHGTFKSYMTGFVLSVILTAIPFWLVMSGGLESKVHTILVVTAFAIAQIIVHVIYFLHVSSKAEGGWIMTSVMFTIVIIFITVFGSVWVMFNMNRNMMPDHEMILDIPDNAPRPSGLPLQSVPQ